MHCLVQRFNPKTGKITYKVFEYERAFASQLDIVFKGPKEECIDYWQKVNYMGWLDTRPKFRER